MTAAVQDAAPAWAVVVAAGQGRRMGEGPAKQFRPLRGHPVLRWSLAALLELKAIRRVALVLAPGGAPPPPEKEAAPLARQRRGDGGAARRD
ncbi:MAG: 2-C-methyl-D-erythritol 4-phosphate cytidylyltransferase, partial [Algiphilus sp.]